MVCIKLTYLQFKQAKLTPYGAKTKSAVIGLLDYNQPQNISLFDWGKNINAHQNKNDWGTTKICDRPQIKRLQSVS